MHKQSSADKYRESAHTNTQTLETAFKLSPERKRTARWVRLTLSNWPTQLKGGSEVYLHTAQRLRAEMLSCTCTHAAATQGHQTCLKAKNAHANAHHEITYKQQQQTLKFNIKSVHIKCNNSCIHFIKTIWKTWLHTLYEI